MTYAELMSHSTMTAEDMLSISAEMFDAAIMATRETGTARIIVLVDGHYEHYPLTAHYLAEFAGRPMIPVAVPGRLAA